MSGWSGLAGLKSFADQVSSNVSSSLQDAAKGLEGASKNIQAASKGLKDAVETAKSKSTILQEAFKVIDLDSLKDDAPKSTVSNASKLGLGDQDVAALAALGIQPLTDRVIAMGFPVAKNGTYRESDIAAVLNARYGSNYMIWNLAEKEYNYDLFEGQVIEYKCPGYPAPPLGMLLKICISMESWLNSDPKNVAVVHCQTGKGRTMVVCACFLAWVGEQASADDALTFACVQRKTTASRMTIPTQRRYVHFFSNMLEGIKPKSPPLQLKRLTMTLVPDMATTSVVKNRSEDDASNQPRGCRPYVQLFKNGNLLFSTAWRSSTSEPTTPFYSDNEGAISFPIDCIVQGDILIRCKHLDARSGETFSMFRAGIHTGFVPSGVLRLSAQQLDGPSSDARFGPDFFVDLVFAPVSTKLNPHPVIGNSDVIQSEVQVSPDKAAEYDRLIEEDAEFWDEVEFRKNRRRTLEKMRQEAVESEDVRFSLADDEEETHFGSPKVDRSASTDLKKQLELLSTSGSVKKDELSKLSTQSNAPPSEAPSLPQTTEPERQQSLGTVASSSAQQQAEQNGTGVTSVEEDPSTNSTIENDCNTSAKEEAEESTEHLVNEAELTEYANVESDNATNIEPDPVADKEHMVTNTQSSKPEAQHEVAACAIPSSKSVLDDPAFLEESLELEELEKELGLESASSIVVDSVASERKIESTPQTSDAKGEEVKVDAWLASENATSTSSNDALAEPDDLEELENYLNGL